MKEEGNAQPQTAIVIGAGGQDGRLLTHSLSERGVRWLGITRHSVSSREVAWTTPVDITDRAQVSQLVMTLQPDEIYHLAAVHQSAESKEPGSIDEFFDVSLRVNVISLVNFLEAIRLEAPHARLFYAASSHVFGVPQSSPQDESTPFRPESIYGITKATGVHTCRLYRKAHAVFAACGILYNHESPLRAPTYLAPKIVDAALAIRAGRKTKLVLGDLEAQVDWGYAPEYVEAMQQILRLPAADDFVIATGRAHHVRDFAEIAFGLLGLEWSQFVEVDAAVLKRRTTALIGDASRLTRATGWRAQVARADYSADAGRQGRLDITSAWGQLSDRVVLTPRRTTERTVSASAGVPRGA